MAKDRRNKQTQKVDLENNVRSGSEARGEKAPKARPSTGTIKKKKKRLSRAAIIIRCALAVLVVTMVIFMAVLGNFLYKSVFEDDREKVPPIDPDTYDTTPVEHAGNVAYYLVGILGKEETDTTNMLAVVCHDKAAGKVQVMQLPSNTYIEEGDDWAVDTLGRVFANPKSLDWCENCGKRLYAPDITEGDVATHTACSMEVSKKKGSSVGSLIDFVNDQLALPVDGYVLMQPETMQVWVDAVGGIDVDLGAYYTLAGIDYEAGVRTLPGAAVVDYLFPAAEDATEETRMVRQREVFGALMTRMLRMDKEALQDNVIEEVQDSRHAARTDYSVEQLTEIVSAMSGGGVSAITVRILPGEGTTDGDGDSVFSAHKNELLTLLNGSFNPYGTPLTQADLLIPELVNTGSSDTKEAPLNTYVPDQTGKLLVESETSAEEGTGEEGVTEEGAAEEGTGEETGEAA